MALQLPRLRVLRQGLAPGLGPRASAATSARSAPTAWSTGALPVL